MTTPISTPPISTPPISLPPEENALQHSLVYLVSRRGAGNFWCTILNGMDKRFTNEEGTLAVQLTHNFRYMLTVHLPYFESCSPALQQLDLVHEAAHVCLNHLPRLFKLLSNATDPLIRTALRSVFNVAADIAANDSIVRLEKDFEKMNAGPSPFLLPETFGFPCGKTMEQYMQLLLPEAMKVLKKLQQMAAGGPSKGKGTGASSGPQVTSPFGSGSGRIHPPSHIPGLPDNIIQQAIETPELFQALQEAFDVLTGSKHTSWNARAETLSPEEVISANAKMKKHAQALVRTAKAHSRGYLPGNAEKIVTDLLRVEQIPWDLFLRDVIQGAIAARICDAMCMPNLALINEDYLEPWPGQTLEFGYNITWMVDTSGSMGDKEYARACACVNSLLAVNKDIHMTYCECDAAMQKEVQVSNVEPPSAVYLEEINRRRGRGGTVYTPFFKCVAGVDEPTDWMPDAPRLKDKHPLPDLIVVCTDGGVSLECFPQLRPHCGIIWLVMPGCSPCEGMENVAPDRVVQMETLVEEET